jgi:hypothetical protein
MTEPIAITPLVQRIAIQRLVAPGILDQRKLQRVHEKFSPPARAPMMSRLFRCAQPAAPSAQGLPVVRIDRFAEKDAPTLTHQVAGSAQIMRASDPRTDASGTNSFIGDKLSRQSPGVTRSTELVTRISPKSTDGASQASVRALARAVEGGGGAHPPVSGLVQRVTENSGGAAVPARVVVSQMLPSAARQPMAFRQAESALADGATLVVSHPTAFKAAPASPGATPLTAFRQANFAQASAPVLMRSLATAASKPNSTGMSSGAAQTATAPFAPLLFRKPDMAAPAAQVYGNPPAITPAAAGVISRSAATPATHPGQDFAATPDVAMDIDWITQQVSSRLSRQLEIERERLGVRPWRQSNY